MLSVTVDIMLVIFLVYNSVLSFPFTSYSLRSMLYAVQSTNFLTSTQSSTSYFLRSLYVLRCTICPLSSIATSYSLHSMLYNLPSTHYLILSALYALRCTI